MELLPPGPELRRVSFDGYQLVSDKDNLTAIVALRLGKHRIERAKKGIDRNRMLAIATLLVLEDLCRGQVALHLLGLAETSLQNAMRVVVVEIQCKVVGRTRASEIIVGAGAIDDNDLIIPAPVRAVLASLNRRLTRYLPELAD